MQPLLLSLIQQAKKNKYFADKAVKFFQDNIDLLYIDTKMSSAMVVFISLIFLTFWGFIAYKSAEVYFKKPDLDERLVQL